MKGKLKKYSGKDLLIQVEAVCFVVTGRIHESLKNIIALENIMSRLLFRSVPTVTDNSLNDNGHGIHHGGENKRLQKNNLPV